MIYMQRKNIALIKIFIDFTDYFRIYYNAGIIIINFQYGLPD